MIVVVRFLNPNKVDTENRTELVAASTIVVLQVSSERKVMFMFMVVELSEVAVSLD